MPRLVYLDSALRDLAGIGAEIEASSGSRGIALSSIARLTRHCERIAALPGLLGRGRPELRADCRSIVAGSYIVFFRYLDQDEPRALTEVLHVLHGARDLKAFFRRTYGRPR